MLEHFQGSFNEKVISLYFKLKEFNSWCTENSGDFKGFDLTNTWAPYITSWLAEVRANSTANVELLLEQETWQPTSSLELHSVSSTRLLSRYFELYSFLDKLEWEDREQYAHFVRVFAESVAVTLREYCVQSSRLLRSLHEKRSGLLDSLQRTRGHSASMVAGETPRSPIPNTQSLLMDSPGMESDDQGDFYRVSQKACVLLNNIEMVRQKMQQLCSAMHIDQAFTQAAEQAMANSVLSAQRIASMPYMDNEDSNISGAVAEGVSLEMQNTASIVFNSLASMSNALAIKLCAPLYEILVSIAAMPSGFNKFIHGISFFDKKSNGPRCVL
ncbi:hypothetical protein SARC_08980 [Sphaeroforma arctica JP610]|uniref:MHD1 domain-containing protein n=1 Tax=Sphaeroforma arctica JP610 TaxID=667725 RepID=A0A0L0FP83_9EUKA|nr:hypothetical protein SARC_08980 [Sphaeroforma arctica JP610]KNC78592.1 hypothetical protein SARC_08980 [Sphaeroforma arctica JP610]|eukprot:XP_014152494.1 hypothetical protein SARC_08980 [Sphaeroforma arctica JP610]